MDEWGYIFRRLQDAGVRYTINTDGPEMLCTDLARERQVLLKAGDMLVQCGTNHAWSNRSGVPAVVCFVLIDGEFDPALEQAKHTHLVARLAGIFDPARHRSCQHLWGVESRPRQSTSHHLCPARIHPPPGSGHGAFASTPRGGL